MSPSNRMLVWSAEIDVIDARFCRLLHGGDERVKPFRRAAGGETRGRQGC